MEDIHVHDRARGVSVNVINKKQRNRGTPAPKKQKKQPTRRKAVRRPSLSPIAKLLHDPCNAAIPPNVFGESSGYTSRFKLSRAIGAYGGTNKPFGYVVWFPDYHCNDNQTATFQNVNVFQWAATTAGAQPAQLSFGAGTQSVADSTVVSIRDCAYDFVNGTTCQDARTLAACLKLRYTGATSTAQGSVYALNNIPLELLINDRPSAATMLQYATLETRASDCIEIKYRPSTASGFFHKANHGPYDVASGQNPALKSAVEAQGPTAIGFLWYGVATQNDYLMDFHKVLEWKPEADSGLVMRPIRGGFTRELLRGALNSLDATVPGWEVVLGTAAAGPAGGTLAAMLRRVVLSGSNY